MREAVLRQVAMAEQQWTGSYGDDWVIRYQPESGHARFMFGPPFKAPFRPEGTAALEDLARFYLLDAQGLLGVDVNTLFLTQARLVRLGPSATEDKWFLTFEQSVDGILVHLGWLKMVLARDGDLLLVNSAAAPGRLALDLSALNGIALAESVALAAFAERTGAAGALLGSAELILYRARGTALAGARLAYSVPIGSPDGRGMTASAGRFFVDAQDPSASVLATEPLLHEVQGPNDFEGNVTAMATAGLLPFGQDSEAALAMPYLEVAYTDASGNSASTYADRTGHFLLAYTGNQQSAVLTFRFRSPYATVIDANGLPYLLEDKYHVGQVKDQLLNPTVTERVTAQANAFLHMNRLRDWVVEANLGLTQMDFQAEARVNVGQDCRAAYVGNLRVEFAQHGASCANQSFSTIVSHEMGHWANDRFGVGNDVITGFGEGVADTWAMFVNDTPDVGAGWMGPGSVQRSGTNTAQLCDENYPGSPGFPSCYPTPHERGMPLMGALWLCRSSIGADRARQMFLVWLDVASNGTIGQHNLEEWLCVDDLLYGDGNLANRTPHWDGITASFLSHGWEQPELGIAEVFHTPRCNTKFENVHYPIVLEVVNRQPWAGIRSVRMDYRVDQGAPVVVQLAAFPGTNTWYGAIPKQAAPASVEYRFAILSDDPALMIPQFEPRRGVFQFAVGESGLVYHNDFDGLTDEGWTHWMTANQDDWQREPATGKYGMGAPPNGWMDPFGDVTGANCWGNDLGSSGEDGAYTSGVHNFLQSPLISGLGLANLRLGFYQWLSVESNAYDHARLSVVDARTLVPTVVWENPGEVRDTSWTRREVDIHTAADGKDFYLRFETEADSSYEYGGWSIDDVSVFTLSAVSTSTDFFVLSGPASAVVGQSVELHVCSPVPFASYSVFSSPSETGYSDPGTGVVLGLGLPITLRASGTTDAAGNATLAFRIPVSLAGTTTFVEAVGSKFYTGQTRYWDSNTLRIDIP